MYKFDRNISEAFQAKNHLNDLHYWKEKSPQERLQAAYYLNASVYGFDEGQEPKLDRSQFIAIKRN